MDKLLLPVPLREWERLRDLATGVAPLEEPPHRRARGTTPVLISSETEVEDTLDSEELLLALRSPARISRLKKLDLWFRIRTRDERAIAALAECRSRERLEELGRAGTVSVCHLNVGLDESDYRRG